MQLVPDAADLTLQALGTAGAARVNARRRELLHALGDRAVHACGGQKPHLGELSPGCVRCAEGAWSCLFLTGVCCADCFFCPGFRSQTDRVAFAERLTFPEPKTYAQYVARLGFRGVSFSGGEPFMVFDKLLAYLEALRAHGPKELYVWAYTNGIPATPARLARAAQAGLDEVRFNIAHDGYRLDRVRAAVGLVPRVTIEIPAIPEDEAQVKALLPELVAAGVRHINLHQLMLSGENGPALLARGYTLAAGTAPVVVESELSALSIMREVVERGLPLAIQYCGLAYKDHWQSRAEDRRGAPLVMRGWESLTGSGYVRRLSCAAAPGLAAQLSAQEPEGGRWQRAAADGRLYLHPELAAGLPADLRLEVVYLRTLLGEPDTSALARRMADYHTVDATPERQIGVRMIPLCAPIPLSPPEVRALLAGSPPPSVAMLERAPEGLGDTAAGG